MTDAHRVAPIADVLEDEQAQHFDAAAPERSSSG